MRSRGFFVFGVRRFLVLALTPVLVLGAYAGLQLAAAQRQAVNLEGTVLANSIKARVEEVVNGYEIALSQMQHLAVGDGDRELLEHFLSEHLPNVESLLFIAPNELTSHAVLGRGVAASVEDFVGLDMSRDRTFLEARESGEPAWSGVFTSTITGEPVICVVVPEHQGAVYATLSVGWLTELMNRVNPPTSFDVAVVGANGDVVYDTEDDIMHTRPSWANITPVANGMRGDAGHYEFELDGERMVGSTAFVSSTGWTVLARQEHAVAMQGLHQTMVAVGTLVVVVAVVAIGAGLNFSRALSRPVAFLARLADDLEHRRPSRETLVTPIMEFVALERSFVSMATSVRERESDLLESRERLLVEVRDKERALARLSAMSSEIAQTEERERRRLAEELHDRVSQALAVARMRLKMAIADSPDDQNLSTIDMLVGQAVTESRAITIELSSPVLYELGFRAAIAETARAIETQYGLPIELELSESAQCVNQDVAALLVRGCRELLTNVVKHSSASKAQITLSADGSAATLQVADDGVGMSPQTAEETQGFGLFSIRERLKHASGSMEVTQRPEGGTVVTIQVPCG